MGATKVGSLRQRDLIPVSTSDDPNLAHEVGAVPKQQGFTACRIGSDRDKQLVFLEELPIQVAWDMKEERLSDGTPHRWWRYEGKVNPDEVPVRARHHLIVVEHPYAIERIHNAPFKTGSRKSREDRPSLDGHCETAKELLTKIEGFGVDYWERGSMLTAGLSMPSTTFRPDGGKRRHQKGALYVLGVVQDFDDAVDILNSTARAHELIRITKNRTIRFWPGNLIQHLRLYDEVAELGPNLMLTSIRQALAGPHALGGRWRTRPVMDLVDRIYRNHLNTYNRKVRRQALQASSEPQPWDSES
jgi:hypothetical protein